MIKDKWWTVAIDIKEKDLIEVNKGIYEEVEEIEVKKYKYPIRVYNLEIEGNHTYYIGEEEILTHNMGNMNQCAAGDITKGVSKAGVGKTGEEYI